MFSYLPPVSVEDVQVQSRLRLLQQIVRDMDPRIDTQFGAITSLVLAPAAKLQASRDAQITAFRNEISYAAIRAGSSASADAIAKVAANFGVESSPARVARGQITLVLSKRAPVFISQGTVFTAAGATFVVVDPVVAKIEPATAVGVSERPLISLPDGTYSFYVDVVAEQAGASGNLPQGTPVSMEVIPDGFVSANARADFSGGSDADTSQDLVKRIQDALAVKTTATRIGLRALIRAAQNFPEVRAVSAVGLGDPELLRGREGVLGIASGLADVYVRSAAVPQTTAVTLNGQMVASRDGLAVWEVTIGREVSPGFWAVVDAVPTALGSGGVLRLVSDVREMDMTPIVGEALPLIRRAYDAVYSRYQTATIRFTDSRMLAASYPLNTVAEFTLQVHGMPNISQIQQLVASGEQQLLTGSVLVRACVPCFVSATVQLAGGVVLQAPPLEVMRSLIVQEINGVNYASRLHTSTLACHLADILPTGVRVDSIQLTGRVAGPDGRTLFLKGESYLELPYMPEQQITYRTVGFVTRPDLVTFSTVTIAEAT